MKKLSYLIIIVLISSLVLAGCLLSNVGQVPTSEQSGINYLTKNLSLADLVGLWHLDEGSGTTAFDSSGNPNDGDLMGGTSWTSGKFGDALSFDGDGDYVHLPASNNILNTNIFTIEAWFKTSVNHPVYGSSDGIGEGRIVNLARDTAGYTAVALYVERDNIAICYHTGAKFKHLRYTVDYHDDTWHHIAVTRDSTTYRLYYDGVEVASQADAFVGFGTSAAYLGTFYPVTTIDPIKRFFNGTIDEVRIWNFALSQDQLGKVYDFVGFFPPVDDNVLNVVKAGRAIPVKFSLDGYQGLEDIIFVPGYPKSIPIVCPGKDEPVGVMEFAETAGESSLSYDADAYQYIYVWKTEKTWAGSCRQLVVKLIDGTSHVANFTFK